MPTVHTAYLGNLRTQATHLQSGTSILTDAPTDNNGRGEAFSPTDLVVTALGSCIITTMGIFAQRHDINLTGSTMDITKVMSSEPPRRIAKIEIKLTMMSETELSDADRQKLIRVAHTCPVAISLHPDVEQIIDFEWGNK